MYYNRIKGDFKLDTFFTKELCEEQYFSGDKCKYMITCISVYLVAKVCLRNNLLLRIKLSSRGVIHNVNVNPMAGLILHLFTNVSNLYYGI